MNNIGTCATSFSRTIGGTTTITNPSVLNAITGEIDLGFIAFDNDGTMGVCTTFTRDAHDNPIYVFRTCSLDTEVDIQSMLEDEY